MINLAMLRELSLSAMIVLTGTSAMACNADSFALKMPYRMGQLYPEYHRPEVDESIVVPSNMRGLLHDAFALAPTYLQERLCQITGLFVATSRDVPWSFREVPKMFPPDSQPIEYGKFIAIPMDQPPPFGQFQAYILRALLDGWEGPTVPEINPEADTPAMTVLSALAHESGHLRWNTVYRPTPGGDFHVERFCGGEWFKGSWVEPVDITPGGGPAAVKSQHLADPQITEIKKALKPAQGQPDYDTVGRLVAQILTGKRFINFWSAYTPEHDWVANYEFKVLMEAKTPLTKMVVKVPVAESVEEIELIERLHGNSEVARKFACFDGLD